MVKRIMGRPRQEECSPQDNALGLMHLRRLFSELCHPPRHMTQKEQEEKLYMMLPVFNRVSYSSMEGWVEAEVNIHYLRLELNTYLRHTLDELCDRQIPPMEAEVVV